MGKGEKCFSKRSYPFHLPSFHRMAVELAEMEVKERGGRLEDARVTIGLIHKAIRDMFATPAVACVRDAALQEKMFLTAFLKSLRRTGTGESTLGEVSNSMNF